MYKGLLISNSGEIRIRTILWFSILLNLSVITVQTKGFVDHVTPVVDLPTNLSPSCEFNGSLCGYKIIRDAWSPNVTWSLISNDLNRTRHSSKGNYVALVGSGKEGIRSFLQSPSFQTAPNDRVEFFYYLSGDNPGLLQVDFIQNYTKTEAHSVHWSDLEDHGASLNYGCMQLPPNRTGRLVFTGILGSSPEKSIAVQNVSISQGRCGHNVQKSMCTFDNSLLCNYSTNCLASSEYTWKRRKGATPTFGTGPDGDVVKPFNGYYLYAESSYGAQGDSASVSFPVENSTGRYLHFWYHMYGESIGSLSLRYHYGQSSIEEWSVSGDQGDKWRYFCQIAMDGIEAFSLVAVRGASYLGDIAIDNVQVDDKACQYGSLDCKFNSPSLCGYNSTNKWWWLPTAKGFKMMVNISGGEYSLKSPIVDVLDSCVGIQYQIVGARCKLNIYENQDMIYGLVPNGDRTWMTAQFYVNQARMYLKMEVNVSSMCEISIDEVTVVKGSCPALECPIQMKSCNDNRFCVNNYQICDQKKDCRDGSDEICTTSLACDFEYFDNCGYGGRNTIKESRNGSDFIVVFGPNSNWTSHMQQINDSCVQFSYRGGVFAQVEVSVLHRKSWKHTIVWKSSFPEKETPWSTGQFFLSAGAVQLTFNVNGRQSSQFTLDDIVLNPGLCPLISCENDGVPCAQNNQCVKKADICNRQIDCLDKSDEMNCSLLIECDFEQANLCGYQYDGGWVVTTGHVNYKPRLDHSTGTYYGHYMVQRYLNRFLYSPEITLEDTTCVRFYYHIYEDNATFHVYDNNVNRLQIKSNNIDKWQMGQLQLSAGKHKLGFVQTTKMYRTTLAIDSISANPGACPEMDCPDKWSRCSTVDICIPYFRICDGEMDCPNGGDENNCTSNSTIRLINGQNVNQGQVEFRVNGIWNKICYQNQVNPSSKANAKVACRQLGYNGSTSDTFRTVYPGYIITNINHISCRGNESSLSQCMIIYCKKCYCKHYFSVDCSNHHCLSDQVPCPGLNGNPYNSSSSCIWKHNLCDGEYDCPGGTDEQNCKDCNGTEFRCRNKKCIPQSQRCNGVPDCQDSSDEHGCFIQNETTIVLMQNGKYQALCEDNINNQTIANELCKAVGRGNGTVLQSIKNGPGIKFMASSKSKAGIISGYYPVRVVFCKLLNLLCNLKGCGTRASWTKFKPTVKYGIFALPGEWPWQTAIYRDDGFYCGGTLISVRYVLTAAHCVRDKMYKYKVRVGSLSRRFGGQVIPVKKIIAHPGFDSKVLKHDVALLELAYLANIDDYVQIACLPYKPAIPNTQCFSTGWGENEQGVNPVNLKEGKVHILTSELCKSYYPSSVNVSICANNAEPYQPVCFGDSGGALQCPNEYGHWEVTGVTSYGQVKCLGKIHSPEAYADVYRHLDWIIENAPYLYK